MRFDDLFLRRVRRRWMVWRMFECGGICAALAGGVGLIIVPILLWRDQPALSCSAILLVIGAAAGFLWACTHRPTILQTAGEIDRQLNLHDLLSTAVRLDPARDEAFGEVVIRQAHIRCAQISLNQLILRRIGVRAWGGIGIVWALLLSLAMLSAHPYLSETQSAQQSSNQRENDFANSPEQTFPPAFATQSASDTQTDHPLNSGDESAPAANAISTDASSSSASHFVSGEGVGQSAGRSADAKNSSLDEFAPHDATTNDSGVSAGGGISTAAHASAHESLASGSVNATPSSTPPWHAGDWSADQDAALREIHSGQIPDSYHDLVRDYFALPQNLPR
jgi:hypothetical protein